MGTVRVSWTPRWVDQDLWHDGQGMCLLAKRLERGRFIWPSVVDGVVTVSPAQLGYLLEGIDGGCREQVAAASGRLNAGL